VAENVPVPRLRNSPYVRPFSYTWSAERIRLRHVDGGAPLRPNPELLWLVLEDFHASSSEALANVWGLPREIGVVLGLHHELGSDRHVHPLAAAVSHADHLAQECGFGLFDECDPAATDAVARKAGIDAKMLEKLRAAVRELAAKFQG
jgi:hypothetical protein